MDWLSITLMLVMVLLIIGLVILILDSLNEDAAYCDRILDGIALSPYLSEEGDL